jgi:hypothetical protein
LLLLSSFFLGLSVDYFSGVPGIHAAASVFMAYARPGVIKLVGLRDDMAPGVEPGIKYFGALWFITYSFILVFLHHIFLFYIEVFRFNEFFITLFRAFVSTLVTVLLVMVVQYLFYRSRD